MKNVIEKRAGNGITRQNNPFINLLKKVSITMISLSPFIPLHSSAQKSTTIAATENHVGLAVKNLDTEKQWYEKVFGMQEEQHLEIPTYNVRSVLLRSPNGLGMELIEVKGAASRLRRRKCFGASPSRSGRRILRLCKRSGRQPDRGHASSRKITIQQFAIFPAILPR